MELGKHSTISLVGKNMQLTNTAELIRDFLARNNYIKEVIFGDFDFDDDDVNIESSKIKKEGIIKNKNIERIFFIKIS